MRNNVLITGANGFVGENLLNYLSDYSHVQTLTRIQLNTVSVANLNGIDTIIHLAGKAHDLKKSVNPQEYYYVNFELTRKLYDTFLQSDAKKFIFISSVKAAADSVDGVLYENVTPNPCTDYGKSKLMAEEYIKSQSLPNGKSYYILRPCMVHGPGNKGNLNLLYKFVKMGIPYPFARFENKRSFLSVQNLCFVIDKLITRGDIANGVYQISDDEPLSTNEVVAILAVSLNAKPQLWKISTKLIKLTAKIGDFFHLPLTTERLNKLTESYVVSNAKIKLALNSGLPLTTIEGLRITASSFNKIPKPKNLKHNSII
jgi:nucleoside-diphosphate-sugar epimerase